MPCRLPCMVALLSLARQDTCVCPFSQKTWSTRILSTSIPNSQNGFCSVLQYFSWVQPQRLTLCLQAILCISCVQELSNAYEVLSNPDWLCSQVCAVTKYWISRCGMWRQLLYIVFDMRTESMSLSLPFAIFRAVWCESFLIFVIWRIESQERRALYDRMGDEDAVCRYWTLHPFIELFSAARCHVHESGHGGSSFSATTCMPQQFLRFSCSRSTFSTQGSPTHDIFDILGDQGAGLGRSKASSRFRPHMGWLKWAVHRICPKIGH